MRSFGMPATLDVHAIWHLGYPWPAGGWPVNETKGRADLHERQQDVTTSWDQHDKTVAHASKRAMLATMGRRNSIHMARVHRPKTIRRFARRPLCNTGTGTSVTGEGLADMVLTPFGTETAAQITRSVLQQTTRRHVRHG